MKRNNKRMQKRHPKSMGTQMGKGKAKESEQARASRLKETRI